MDDSMGCFSCAFGSQATFVSGIRSKKLFKNLKELINLKTFKSKIGFCSIAPFTVYVSNSSSLSSLNLQDLGLVANC